MLVAVLLVACGGSNASGHASSPSPSSSPSASGNHLTVSDVCTLVTAADASQATGTTLTNVGAGGQSIPGVCIYGNQDGSTGVLVYAQAYPDASAAGQVQPNQITAAFRGQYGISNAKSVTGIGDKASEFTATSASGSSGLAIFVSKANVVLFILMTPATDSAKIETLAKTAVSRLS